MRITSIAVEGVGKFGTPAEIGPLGPGVNILAAGNEAGKSTLFRAVRTCLFERHGTSNAAVRSLATEGLSLPVTVSIGFDLAGEAYTIEKSFLKSPTASLRRGGVEFARGREADERLWDLLRIVPRTVQSVDEAAFGVLWVGQGHSFAQPKPSDAATTALNEAIQDEVGTLVGGERARKVLAALRADLGRMVTDTGRPKTGGPLHAAVTRLEDIDRELAGRTQRLLLLDDQLDMLASRRRERDAEADPAVLRERGEQLAAARTALDAAKTARGRLERAEAAEQQAAGARERMEERLADLAARAARIDADQARATAIDGLLGGLDGQERAAQQAIAAAQKALAAIDAAARAADETERQLQGIAAALLRESERAARSRRLAALEALAERLIRNRAARDANPVTAAMLARLDAAEKDAAVCRARLEAAAPRVTIALGPQGAGRVQVNGAPLAGDGTLRPLETLAIAVGDLATVTVAMPADGKDHAALRRAEAGIAALLAEANLPDAAALRAAHAARQALDDEARQLTAELRGHDVQGESPAAAIEALKAAIVQSEVMTRTALDAAGLDELPTADALRQRQDALRAERDAAGARRPSLDGTIQAQNAALTRLAGERGRTEEERRGLQHRLTADRAALPDADRAARLAEAGNAHDRAVREHGARAAALAHERDTVPPPEEVARLENRIARLDEAMRNQQARLGTLDREIANLEGQIQNAGGDGLGEQVAALQEEREIAVRAEARARDRVETLQLLRDTVDASYREQRDRLQAPLRRHLKPFLNDVFPASEIEFGDDFAVTRIRRRGPLAESFQQLSAGTQEQIAVLVRLAMGAMLNERGQEVPIILDDALVFSDDERIERMFDALSRAGQKQQVIVLTCRTRTFRQLGGRMIDIRTL